MTTEKKELPEIGKHTWNLLHEKYAQLQDKLKLVDSLKEIVKASDKAQEDYAQLLDEQTKRPNDTGNKAVLHKMDNKEKDEAVEKSQREELHTEQYNVRLTEKSINHTIIKSLNLASDGMYPTFSQELEIIEKNRPAFDSVMDKLKQHYDKQNGVAVNEEKEALIKKVTGKTDHNRISKFKDDPLRPVG